MNIWRLALAVITLLFPVLGYAANSFLDAKNDQGGSAKFRGTEWSDDIAGENISLTARAVTTRIAKMPWGSIFKIEFTDLKSRAEKQRDIRPDYFIVTDSRIVLLNEIKLKGDLCIYESNHPSGHFKKVGWEKGVGLLEYASGYGAHVDGYRLKRVTNR